MKGWTCPNCGAGVAPWVSMCPRCPAKVVPRVPAPPPQVPYIPFVPPPSPPDFPAPGHPDTSPGLPAPWIKITC